MTTAPMWLLLLGSAWALPQLWLPPDEDPSRWADAAALAGLGTGPAEDGTVAVVVEEGLWNASDIFPDSSDVGDLNGDRCGDLVWRTDDDIIVAPGSGC